MFISEVRYPNRQQPNFCFLVFGFRYFAGVRRITKLLAWRRWQKKWPPEQRCTVASDNNAKKKMFIYHTKAIRLSTVRLRREVLIGCSLPRL